MYLRSSSPTEDLAPESTSSPALDETSIKEVAKLSQESEQATDYLLAKDEPVPLLVPDQVKDLVHYSLIPETEQVFANDENNPYITYGIVLLQLEDEQLRGAITQLKKISAQYSSVGWYGVSNLLLAYAYHRAREYNLAVQHGQDFLALNPSYPNADYVQYLIASSHYKMIGTVEETAENLELALFAYQELINNYPNSRYIKQAQLRINEINSQEVEKVMHTARWYQLQRENIAALTLFMDVIVNYPNALQTAEAYFRVAEIYYTMGADKELTKIINKLVELYPATFWSQEVEKLRVELAD